MRVFLNCGCMWIYVVYITVGLCVAVVLYAFQTWISPDIRFKADYLPAVLVAGGFFGYVLARLRVVVNDLTICAATDPLTQLNNRTRFNEFLERETLRSNRHGTDLSVIILDIDSFNKIKKNYGQKTANSVLLRISSIVKSVSRDVDICAKWGADDFIIMLPDTNLEGARITAERLRARIADEFIPVVGQTTASLGVAQFRPQQDLKETFIDRADSALFRVKEKGRNGVEVEEAVDRFT